MATEAKQEELKRVLGFWDCMSFCVGQIIGSGIMVLTGISLGLTGHGVPFAFLTASVIIMVVMVPQAVLGSAMPQTGGNYAYIRELIGKKSAFLYAMMFAVSQCLIATIALGFAKYFQAIFPSFDVTVVAMIALTFCVGLNMFGLKTAAKVQAGMVIILLASLTAYIIFGLPKVDFSVFTGPKAIMPKGIVNFLTASALLYFALGGAKFIADMGGEIKEPGKNIPRSMFISTAIVAVFYALMGIVASGVLPLEKVAGKTLVISAKEIFPPAVYYFFVIGGAWFALLTTLFGTLSWTTKGLYVASKEGWLPESFAATTKNGVPYKILLLYYVIGAVPILLKLDLSFIASMGVGITVICNVLPVSAAFFLAKKRPDLYKNASYKIKEPLLILVTAVSVVLLLATGYLNLKNLNMTTWISLAVFTAACIVYAFIREKYVLRKLEEKKQAVANIA